MSKWKPSKAKKDEYKKKMAQIESFCEKIVFITVKVMTATIFF